MTTTFLFAHYRWGEKGCISCRKAEKSEDSNLCSACETSMRNIAPVLVRVPEDNVTFDNGARRVFEAKRSRNLMRLWIKSSFEPI